MERREFRGERLKYARIFRGKSLTELANESGISKQLISQYENGDSRPSHERLFNISEILHFPYDFFMVVIPFISKLSYRELSCSGRSCRSL